MQYTEIRELIVKELKSLKDQQAKLEAVLKQLDSEPAVPPTERIRRGKVPPRAKANARDLAKAMELVSVSGKSGVNVVRMSHVLRGAGFAMPKKEQFMETGRVKVVGKGGGSAYVFTG